MKRLFVIPIFVITTVFVTSFFFSATTLHAQVTWQKVSSPATELPNANGGSQQTATQVFDANGDGTDEFFIAERTQSPSVVMYKKTASGWSKSTVDTDTLRIEAGGAHYDIDRDGDIDLVFSGDSRSNEIWWWENPGRNNITNTWTRRIIKNSGTNKHHDSAFGDVDGDGAVEFITWNQGGNNLLLFDVPANPKQASSWQSQTIYTWSGQEHEGMAIVDVNGDGIQDIVGGGRWFEYKNGSFIEHTVDNNQTFGRANGGQFVRGGWAELVFGPGDATGRLKYYSYNGSTWVSKDIAGVDVDHGHSLDIGDIDGDGNLDIYCAEMRLNDGNSDSKNWVFYGDGAGNFSKQVVSTGIGNHESKLGDFDGDGDIDILGKPYNWNSPTINLWINTSGNTTPSPDNNTISLDDWSIHTIDSNKEWKSIFITGGDIDNDGKNDIITGGWWYKNPGTNNGTWQKKTIGGNLFNIAAVNDFDNDGDLDIMGTNGKHSGSTFSYAQNNGSGTFTVSNGIANGSGDFLQGVVVGNITGTANQIALSWHNGGSGVELLTKSGNTWSISTISTTSQDEDLSIGNIDRSGGTDLLLGTKWLQNTGGSFTPKTLYSFSGSPDRNELVDINNDGKLDAVVGYEAISTTGLLAWYEQGSSATSTWTEHTIGNVTGPMSLDAKDMDNDGDIDIVVGEHNLNSPSSAGLYIFENRNNGSAWTKHTVHIGNEHHDGAQTIDIDGDGDLDIVSIGWGHNKVLLYENTSSTANNTPNPTITPSIDNNLCEKPGDVDCNGSVSINELKHVFSRYGTNDRTSDETGSGRVTMTDIVHIITENENLGGGNRLPTPQPTTSVLPTNTPPPDASGGGRNEVLLFDKGGLSFTEAENGFDVLISQNNTTDHGPSNWLSPIDYWNGQFQVRYYIEQHPSSQAGKLQVCIWTMPNYQPESCSGQVSYSKSGDTIYNTKVFPNAHGLGLPDSEKWFRIHGVLDYSSPDKFLIRNVLRGASGCNVTSIATVDGRCPEEFSKYQDMRVRITIVLVPSGSEFSGWNNYPL